MPTLRICAKAIWLTLCFAFGIHNARAQYSVDQARDLARTAIQDSTHRGKDTFFSGHRLEDLEDDFCFFGWFRGDFANAPCAFFFEVSLDGYEFRDGKVISHASVDGESLYYVAVSRSSGEVYRISGFKDSNDEFNRLASAYRIRTGEDNQALRYADLFLRATRELLELPKSVLDLKQLVERKFNASYSNFGVGEKHFEVWWGKFGSALASTSFEPTASQAGSGFVITFLTVSDINDKHRAEGPGLLKISLEISPDGQVKGPKFEPVALP